MDAVDAGPGRYSNYPWKADDKEEMEVEGGRKFVCQTISHFVLFSYRHFISTTEDVQEEEMEQEESHHKEETLGIRL